MRWFKHFSDARNDKKVSRLIDKYGIEGYGLYFAIIEMISCQLSSENPMPDLEEEAQDMARIFKMDTLKVEEIIKYCINEGLFQINIETKRVICLKLLTHLDNHLARNPEIRKILSNFKKLYPNNVVPTQLQRTPSNQTILDKIRLDKNIKDIEKKNIKENKYIKPLLDKWLECNLRKHDIKTVKYHWKKKADEIIELYSLPIILKSIENYAKILHSDEYYYSHSFDLCDFIVRASKEFIDTADPFTNYLSNTPKTPPPELTPAEKRKIANFCPDCGEQLVSNAGQCMVCRVWYCTDSKPIPFSEDLLKLSLQERLDTHKRDVV